jgi:hypothetical protein
MNEIRQGETKLREQQERAAEARATQSCEHPSHLVWKIVGGMALAVVAAGLIASLNDIRRYVRIMKM